MRKTLFPHRSRRKDFNILLKPIFDTFSDNNLSLSLHKLLRKCRNGEVSGRNPKWQEFIFGINKIGHIIQLHAEDPHMFPLDMLEDEVPNSCVYNE